MDAFEKNKIAGAILSALLLTVSINVVTNAFFEKSTARVVGYDLPSEGEAATPGKESIAAEPAVPLPVMLAKADPARGEKALGKCKACHSFEKGGPNRVGPNLYGIISHTMGAAVGFNYSSAFKAKNAEKAVWTFEAMDQYLTNPKAYIKGTNMAFAGISKAEERADIIAYLRTLSDSPVPLPAAPAPTAAAPTPPAPTTPPPAAASPKAQGAPSSAAPPSPPAATAPTPPAAASPKAQEAPSSAAPSSPPAATAPTSPAAASPKAQGAPSSPAATSAPAAAPLKPSNSH